MGDAEQVSKFIRWPTASTDTCSVDGHGGTGSKRLEAIADCPAQENNSFGGSNIFTEHGSLSV